MKSDTLKVEIDALKAELNPLQVRLARLERDHRDALSREFIAAQGITRDQVETSEKCESKPWFDHIADFVDWLKWHPGKPWAEWNGMLYETSELMAGRMTDTPARYEHLR